MDLDTFRHIARIARLDEDPQEFLEDFDEILKLLKRVESISFPEESEEKLSNPLREDERIAFPGDATMVFPKKKNSYLEVPKNL